MHKECVAMILAGGQGSRLGVLTENIAKPAVPFGGKYRIIDFALSNCSHSGIETVGVLTQYQPLVLNTYIGSGQAWDLDRNMGGVYVLPPFLKAEKGEWYSGTANAIFQNVNFIEQFDPDNILILSGDHIYKMHYGKMLKAHKKSGAAVTIAVIEVPWEEASRFGIMNVDENDRVIEFEEKPDRPKSNLASMGIYVFDWGILKKHLFLDNNNLKSKNDFGKNVIPGMLAAGEKMCAYRFDGYWKDVGTVQSLWEANMDLLETPPSFDLYDNDWKIFSRSPVMPPHYVSENAKLRRSCVTEGCEIYGEVSHSIIFQGVKIGEGAVVTDSILMPGVTVGKGTVVNKAIVGYKASIGDNAIIGDKHIKDDMRHSKLCQGGITVIGDKITIDDGVRIAVNSMVETSILHNQEIGNRPKINSSEVVSI